MAVHLQTFCHRFVGGQHFSGVRFAMPVDLPCDDRSFLLDYRSRMGFYSYKPRNSTFRLASAETIAITECKMKNAVRSDEPQEPRSEWLQCLEPAVSPQIRNLADATREWKGIGARLRAAGSKPYHRSDVMAFSFHDDFPVESHTVVEQAWPKDRCLWSCPVTLREEPTVVSE